MKPEYGKSETGNPIEIKKVNNFRTVGNIKNSEGRTLKEGCSTEAAIFINSRENHSKNWKIWE